jgi:hypothetical protein
MATDLGVTFGKQRQVCPEFTGSYASAVPHFTTIFQNKKQLQPAFVIFVFNKTKEVT